MDALQKDQTKYNEEQAKKIDKILEMLKPGPRSDLPNQEVVPEIAATKP